MPNHFHFLVQANATSAKIVKETPIMINAYTEGIRLLLSSYAKAIQKQESLTGNLFQLKTKFKCVDGYEAVAFNYIHQNPVKAKLVQRMEDWKWSSLPEYIGLSSECVCNREIAYTNLNLRPERLLDDSYRDLSNEVIEKLY